MIALVVAVVQAGGATAAGLNQPEARDMGPLGIALLATSGLVLVLRRRFPVTTFAVASSTVLAYLVLDYPEGPLYFGMIVALVTTVFLGRRRAAIAEIAVSYVAFVTFAFLQDDGPPDLAFALGLAAWHLVLLTGAEAVRARRERAAEEARTREEEARRRVTEERLRIARELHDVVAHNISLVNLQAGVALHLMDDQPDAARGALGVIKDASKEALVELRSVLGVLRQVDEANDAPRAPTPGLGRLGDLVSQAAAAGVEAAVVTAGDQRPLPAGLDLAAFRIVQEALTNVARHAGPTRAEVRVGYEPSDLVVEVVDEGRRAAGPPPGTGLGAGHGVAGMRERAEAVGGELEAGPRPGFGWRVRARFPLPSPDDASTDDDAGATTGG